MFSLTAKSIFQTENVFADGEIDLPNGKMFSPSAKSIFQAEKRFRCQHDFFAADRLCPQGGFRHGV
jgi:hypothetical protein